MKEIACPYCGAKKALGYLCPECGRTGKRVFVIAYRIKLWLSGKGG